MADSPTLVVLAGVDNDPVIFDCFDDDEQTARTDFSGWTARFVAFHDTTGSHVVLVDTRSGDVGGYLSVAAATDGPTGDWLVLTLPAALTAAFDRSGQYTLVLVDNGNPDHIEELIPPTGFSVRQLEFAL